MKAMAGEGFFVRDAERNLVYCPCGEILRQKAIKKNGNIRYCNRLACKRCKNKCTTSDFKEVDFDKDTLIVACRKLQKEQDGKNNDNTPPKPRRKATKVKVVRFKLHLDQKKMNLRKCISEHPFGTIKRTLGQYYFLLKGKVKVTAEMALFCLSYNLRRALNMSTPKQLLAAMA